MKALLLLILTLCTARAESFAIAWDYDSNSRLAAFEIDSRTLKPMSQWAPIGTAFDNAFSGDLPRGTYQFRVRARMISGEVSAWSNLCTFTLPTPPPPVQATHVRLTIRNAEGRIVNSMLDPIAGRAFYRMAPEGPPHVQKSTNLLQWEAVGQGCPPGEYKLESTLITVTQ